MDTSPKSFSFTNLAIGVLIAGAIGAGGTYLYAQMTVKEEGGPDPTPAPQGTPVVNNNPPPAAPPPVKIEFLGAGKVSGAKATSPDGKVTADLAPNDAMIVWLKMEGGARRRQQASAPQAGSVAGAPLPTAGPGEVGPMASLPPERGSNMPISVKDDQGREYAFVGERKDEGVVALHLRKGYDTRPKYLEVAQLNDGKVLKTWKVDNVPAPATVLPADSLKGQPEGEIRLQPDANGKLGAIVHLDTPVRPNQGFIVKPVAASYTPLSSDLIPNGVISQPGKPFEGRIPVPNAGMQKLIAVDVQPYEVVTTVETVTFKTASIKIVFDQPTMMIEKNEVVKTPSGTTITLLHQLSVPKRRPSAIRPKVLFDIFYDGRAIPRSTVPGVNVAAGIQLVSPKPADFGLEQIVFRQANLALPPGTVPYQVISLPEGPALPGSSGPFKEGPIPALTVQLVVSRPRLLPVRRVVLPVNPTPLPAK